MGRTIISEASVEKYLEHLLESDTFSYGIIIGQPSKSGKDYVIHLARIPVDTADELNRMSSDSSVIEKYVSSINTELLIDHALSAVRMIPGSFFILGIFLVSSKNVFDYPEDFKQLKHILKKLSDVIRSSKSIYACSDEYDNSEKLILNYNGKRAFSCKSIELEDLSKSGNGKPAEWKFQDKSTHWHQIETIYETDHVFPLIKGPNKCFNIEENIDISVDSIEQRLAESFIFFDGESLDATESLDNVLKKKTDRTNETAVIQGSIYLPCKEKIKDDDSKIVRYDGTVKYSGVICSKIWVHSKTAISDIQQFIKFDILRSISGRLRIYLDAYSITEQQFGAVILNEPPRRVFYPLNSSCPIMFCDYIFRRENEETVIAQAKEIMDIELGEENIITNIETIPEIGYDDESLQDENSSEKLPSSAAGETKRVMFILGIFFAVGVVFISIGLHFIFNYE